MSVPNGYTKEMIKEMLGTSMPDPPGESGNVMRRRKGQEMRDGTRPFPAYKTKQTGPNFDEDGKYIYPKGSGFRYTEFLKDNPNSTEAISSNKVS